MSKPFFNIEDRIVGEDFPPLIIPEIGINHNGSLKICKELIYDTLYNPGQFIFKTMVIYSGIKCVELIKNQLVY